MNTQPFLPWADKSQRSLKLSHPIGISWPISNHVCGFLSSSKAFMHSAGHQGSLESLLSSSCVERLVLCFFLIKLALCSLLYINSFASSLNNHRLQQLLDWTLWNCWYLAVFLIHKNGHVIGFNPRPGASHHGGDKKQIKKGVGYPQGAAPAKS